MPNQRSATPYVSRRQQNWSRNQNTTRFMPTVKLGPVMHTVILGILLVLLGLIYLTQATKATGYDYATNQADQRITEMKAEMSDLEIENARLTSLNNIKNSSIAKTMQNPIQTEYAEVVQ